jgi:sugar phosphate isomerase/epimerase
MEISPMNDSHPTPRPAPFVPGGNPDAVGIGINSVEWRTSTLEEVLQSVQRHGAQLVELVARKNVWTETVPQAKALFAEHGIRPNSVSAFTKLNEVVHERVAETQELINYSIEIAAVLGAPFSHTYFGANAFLDDDEAIARYVEFLKPCLRKAEQTGVTLLIDNLFDSVPSEIPATFRQHYRSRDVTRSARGCRQLLESVNSPWFQYNYDPGNFLVSGEEPYPYAYEVLKDFIRSIHLKDAVKYDWNLHGDPNDLYLQRDLRGDFMCVAIGAGAVNYEAILKRLRADGYQGNLILEPHTGDRRIDAAIKDSLKYLADHGYPGQARSGE